MQVIWCCCKLECGRLFYFLQSIFHNLHENLSNELHPFFKWTTEVNGTRSCLITISSLDSRSKAYSLEINALLHYVLLLEKWNERLVLLYVKINILERTTEWKNGKELGRNKESMKLKEGGLKWREEGKKESRKEGRKEGGNEEGGREEKRREGRKKERTRGSL